jgi:hypothetical protein
MRAMDTKPAPLQHLFIVRLWSEQAQPLQASLRGSVEHIPSGQKFYFTSLNDLSDFITLKASVQPPPTPKGKEIDQ